LRHEEILRAFTHEFMINFKVLSYTERLQNFERLLREKAVNEIMAHEYAGIINQPAAEVFEQMWHYNQVFFAKRDKKAQPEKNEKKLR